MRAAMSEAERAACTGFHSHVFLGEGHEKSERRAWARLLVVQGGRVAARPSPNFKLRHYVCREHTDSEGGVELQKR